MSNDYTTFSELLFNVHSFFVFCFYFFATEVRLQGSRPDQVSSSSNGARDGAELTVIHSKYISVGTYLKS